MAAAAEEIEDEGVDRMLLQLQMVFKQLILVRDWSSSSYILTEGYCSCK